MFIKYNGKHWRRNGGSSIATDGSERGLLRELAEELGHPVGQCLEDLQLAAGHSSPHGADSRLAICPCHLTCQQRVACQGG